MITIRPASARGSTKIGWLDSRHTFSFGEYEDPAQMGFHSLRVINDDRVAPGAGFGTHGHRDMEIFSYVLEGALMHRDSMGNGSTIRPGELQRMTAGTGVTHSEKNGSTTEAVHFLQIWIEPAVRALQPGYAQADFPIATSHGHWLLLASPQARDGSLIVHQDVDIHAVRLDASERIGFSLREGRAAWVHVARGAVSLGGRPLLDGDGAGIERERELEFVAAAPGAEVLLFDIAN